MPRKVLYFDLFADNPASCFIKLPQESVFRGIQVHPGNDKNFRVWFEGDPDYHKDPIHLSVLKDGDPTPNGGTHLGSFIHTDLSSGHVYMAPHRPVCKCDCAKGGDCMHDWNGPWVGDASCSSCGIHGKEHGFPLRLQSSPYPRLRKKSDAPFKDDCINCDGIATNEIVLGKTQIRCCGNPDCIDRATEVAKELSASFP